MHLFLATAENPHDPNSLIVAAIIFAIVAVPLVLILVAEEWLQQPSNDFRQRLQELEQQAVASEEIESHDKHQFRILN